MNNKYACTVAALLLAAMIAAILINGSFVRRTSDNILSALQNLSEESQSSEIYQIAEYWEDQRKILTITLSEPELDKISSLFDDLIIDADENDTEEYKKTMARLKRAIEDIRKYEEISLENIF